MPLIVLTGVPCSGKTTRAEELKQYFEEQGKEVYIISEYAQIVKAGFDKNAFYADSNKEKHIRGLLKSEMLKLISSTNVVILDALNYIKGYRYELFCGSKANKSTQCTVHTEINRDMAWEFNENRECETEKYTRETFDALLMRYLIFITPVVQNSIPPLADMKILMGTTAGTSHYLQYFRNP